MSIELTVITTAPRTRRFLLSDPAAVAQVCESLRNGGRLFSGKPLIIGSAGRTEVFAATSIACLELATDIELDEYLPKPTNLTLTALPPGQCTEPFVGRFEGERFTVRVEFRFTGGHKLVTRVDGVRKPVLAERVMNLTSLFERPLLDYRLTQRGVGLMNPHAVTQFVITPGVPDLPKDAWLADVT